MKRTPPLPSPGVHFANGFLARLAALQARRSRGAQRSLGMGHLNMGGAGAEFVGYRRYRPGEDLRLFDWSLYSRMRQSYVRVTRREANQTWAILLDTSASMGLGDPGKLQLGAEVAAALCSVGLASGSRVMLHCTSTGETVTHARRQAMGDCLAFLGTQTATGKHGLGKSLAHPARFRGAGSVFMIGDMLDVEPAEALHWARRGRQLHMLQLLCDDELNPPRHGTVLWTDPESGQASSVNMADPVRLEYEARLRQHRHNWDQSCKRHRAFHRVWCSTVAFEDVVQEVLGS